MRVGCPGGSVGGDGGCDGGCEGRARSPVDDVEMTLARIERLMRTQGRAELADLGVTRDQFHALLVLRDAERAMGELAERLGVTCSTVTDLVDRMERAGLAERARDGGDRRVVRVRITPGGEAVLAKVRERRRMCLGRVLESMTKGEQQTLRDLLARVYSLLSRLPGM